METLNAELFKIEYPNRAIVRDKSFANDAGYRINEKTDDYWMNNVIGDAGRSTSWIVYLRFENNVTFEDHDLVDLLVDDLLIAGKTITFFENWYHVTFDPTDDPENEGELLSAFRFIKAIRDAVHPISVEKAGVVQKKHIRLQGNAKLKNDDIEGLTEKLSIIEAKADSPVSSSLGSIKPTDSAPTPTRNGNYTFSIEGNKPAWLTAEAGITTVKAGDGVAVVYTEPSSYTYTHIDMDGAFIESYIRNPINVAPYLGLTGQTTGVRSITKAGLGGEILTKTAAFNGKYYTTQVAVTFQSKTGLDELRGYVGTSQVFSIKPDDIVVGTEYIWNWSAFLLIVDQSIVSQFRLQCSGTPNVNYTIRYIVCFEGVYQKDSIDKIIANNYTGFGVDTADAASYANTANTANIANTANTANTAKGVAGGVLPFALQNIAQIDPLKWTGSNNDKFDENFNIIIRKGESRAQFTVPSAVTVGQKYIAIFNVWNLKLLGNGATGMIFYNFSQNLFTVNKDGLYYSVFTANVTGNIQVVMNPTVQNGDGSPYISFNSNICAITPYSEQLENVLKVTQKAYTGGVLLPTFSLLGEAYFPEQSFNQIVVANNKVKQINNLPGLNYYKNIDSAPGATEQYTEGKILFSGTMPYTGVGSPFFFCNIGYDFTPALYADIARTFVVVIKGTYTGTNTKEIYLQPASGADKALMLQDVFDDTPTPFAAMIQHTYPQGSTTFNRYVYFKHTPKNTGVDIVFDYEITDYFAYEAVSGWSIDDYLANVDKAIIIPLYNAPGTAKTEYIDNEVGKLRNEVATKVLSTPYSAQYGWDINMLINYGQSLSVGGGASDTNTNFRRTLSFPGGNNEWASNVDINDPTSVAAFYGDDFVLLPSVSNTYFAPVNTNAIAWMSCLEKENNVDLSTFDYQFILSTPGYSGAPIESFAKGTIYYNRLLFSVQKAFNHSAKLGKTFGVPALFWVQGEANVNDTQAVYYGKLSQLFSDLNTDIKAVTGQTEDVAFITYQMAPVIGVEGRTDSGPSFAHLQAAQDIENCYLGGAMYQFAYGDFWHPIDRAIIGLQAGIVAKRVINDKKPYPLFFPINHYIQNNAGVWLLNIKFGVPVPPMRFDVSGDIWHNPNGKQPNFGFTLLNASGVNIIAEEPTIRRGDTMIIKCTENPTGAKLNYALNGHYGGGNLCDSQNIIVRNKNIDYVVDNFCVAFKDYII